MTEAGQNAAAKVEEAAEEIVEVVFDSGNWPLIAFLALVFGFGAAWIMFYYLGQRAENADAE